MSVGLTLAPPSNVSRVNVSREIGRTMILITVTISSSKPTIYIHLFNFIHLFNLLYIII